MHTILVAHQSAEMYGSDRVLLYLLEGLSGSAFNAVVVVPVDGPLVAALRAAGLEVHVIPLVKVSRKTLGLLSLLRLPGDLRDSIRAIDNVLSGRKVEAVYSNTVAVLAAAVWAYLKGVPHLWHVHEILLKPTFVRKLFPFLIRLFSDRVVCNSEMTRSWIVGEQKSLDARTVVIWNGQGSRPEKNLYAVARVAEAVRLANGEVVVALVGRVNKWKGQSVLVDAATILWDEGVRNIRFVFVGGAVLGEDGQTVLSNLLTRMKDSPACENLVWLDYIDDVWCIWDLCDIAVVPSIEPEPFGMVAIEAMASGRPVIAAAHGGLTDIVVDGETGFLVQPRSASSLALAIKNLALDPELRREMGRKGQLRQRKVFSLDQQVESTRVCIESLIEARRP